MHEGKFPATHPPKKCVYIYMTTTMKVKYTGLKHKAPTQIREACTNDVFTQEDFFDDDLVAVLQDGNKTRCYNLEQLATWFLEQTISFGRLPTLPDNRAPVPHTVYKQVVDGTLRDVGCERIVQRISHVSSAVGREFALTGQRNVNRTRTRQESRVLSDIEQLRRQMPSSASSSSPPQGQNAMSDTDLDEILSELLNRAEDEEVIDMAELERSLPSNVLEALDDDDGDELIRLLNNPY